jgi:hypothetical protein
MTTLEERLRTTESQVEQWTTRLQQAQQRLLFYSGQKALLRELLGEQSVPEAAALSLVK